MDQQEPQQNEDRSSIKRVKNDIIDTPEEVSNNNKVKIKMILIQHLLKIVTILMLKVTSVHLNVKLLYQKITKIKQILINQ